MFISITFLDTPLESFFSFPKFIFLFEREGDRDSERD